MLTLKRIATYVKIYNYRRCFVPELPGGVMSFITLHGKSQSMWKYINYKRRLSYKYQAMWILSCEVSIIMRVTQITTTDTRSEVHTTALRRLNLLLGISYSVSASARLVKGTRGCVHKMYRTHTLRTNPNKNNCVKIYLGKITEFYAEVK